MNLTHYNICLGDVLSTTTDPPAYYLVRQVHHGVRNQSFRVAGYTLLEIGSLTDREVEINELRNQLQQNTLVPYYPQIARRVRWDKAPDRAADWHSIQNPLANEPA